MRRRRSARSWPTSPRATSTPANGPPLNAFLTLNPNAVAQAEALDRAVAAGEPKGPLFCVPVAVKDNFDTYDMPTTVGSLALIGNQPPRDAPFVARLRAAGAIIVGKTNMDEFAMGIRGLSGAGGRVGNAYDTRAEPRRLVERLRRRGRRRPRAARRSAATIAARCASPRSTTAPSRCAPPMAASTALAYFRSASSTACRA